MAVGTVTERDLATLAKAMGAEPFRIHEVRRQDLDAPDAVWAELGRLEVLDGWLCVTDRVHVFESPTRIEGGEAPPLDGELRLDEKTSVHLRHLGESRWRLSWLCSTEDAAGCARRRTFFAATGDGRRLAYEVDWRLHEDAFGQPVLRPYRSRFAGFLPRERRASDA